MTERATPAPPHFPFPDHRTMDQVYPEIWFRPVMVDVPKVEQQAHKAIAGKIWCKHCEVNWAPKAVRACVRKSCPAKVELP